MQRGLTQPSSEPIMVGPYSEESTMVRLACPALLVAALALPASARAQVFSYAFEGGQIRIAYPVKTLPADFEALEQFREAASIAPVHYALIQIDNRKGRKPVQIIELFTVDDVGRQVKLEDGVHFILFDWQTQESDAETARERLAIEQRWNEMLGPVTDQLESQRIALPGAITNYLFINKDSKVSAVKTMFALADGIGRIELHRN